MILLVTGGRNYDDAEAVDDVLDALHAARPIELLVTGGATGADRLAEAWARRSNVAVSVHPADWKRHGRAAGPIRNRAMLRDCKPSMVIAFPGGKGTADMVRAAREYGCDVLDGDDHPHKD